MTASTLLSERPYPRSTVTPSLCERQSYSQRKRGLRSRCALLFHSDKIATRTAEARHPARQSARPSARPPVIPRARPPAHPSARPLTRPSARPLARPLSRPPVRASCGRKVHHSLEFGRGPNIKKPKMVWKKYICSKKNQISWRLRYSTTPASDMRTADMDLKMFFCFI